MNTNRIYGHQELALLYFPNVLPSSASTQLTRFIRRDPELLSALEAIGYRKGKRLKKGQSASVGQCRDLYPKKRRTCFRKKSYVFFAKHVRVFLRTFTAVIRSRKRNDE